MGGTDPRGSNSAFHLEAGKPRVDLLHWTALLGVAEVAAWGVAKYGERNWEEHAASWHWGQLLGSALRHIFYWAMREDLDPESGKPHLAHAVWNLCTLLELTSRGSGVDDRTKLMTRWGNDGWREE